MRLLPSHGPQPQQKAFSEVACTGRVERSRRGDGASHAENAETATFRRIASDASLAVSRANDGGEACPRAATSTNTAAFESDDEAHAKPVAKAKHESERSVRW